MLLTSKLVALAATTAVALALTAGTAVAQLEVHDETSGTECGEVTLDGHDVSGGCVIELQSTEHIPIAVYTPTPVVISSCNWHLEARIGEGGQGYVTQAVLSDEDPPTTPPCTRAPCDEAAESGDAMIPWPLDLVENGPGDEEAIVEICLRSTATGEGGPPATCKISLDLGEIANHELEIGRDPWEEFCEISPIPFVPVSIRDAHFTYEEGSEAIEVVHETAPDMVQPEAPAGAGCGTVTLTGHSVSGGCHVEFQNTGNGVAFHAYLPAKTTLYNCDVYFEAQVGGDGSGYVTEADFTPAPVGTCLRVPCDEDAGASDTTIPWPLEIVEAGAGDEELRLLFCLRAIGAAEGTAGSQCEVHLELTTGEDHEYELGHEGPGGPSEVFCENNTPNPEMHHPTLPIPTSIEPHLVTTGDERVEIVH